MSRFGLFLCAFAMLSVSSLSGCSCGSSSKPECSIDDDCLRGYCYEGDCVDCYSNEHCNRAGYCVDNACVNRASCDQGMACAEGVCVDGLCMDCLTDQDCEDGKICADTVCAIESVDHCQGISTCNNHGECDDGSGSIACTCLQGYAGDRCESCATGYQDYGDGACSPSDPCALDDPCQAAHRDCDNDQGTASCGDCLAGYSENAGGTCVPDTGCQADTCSDHGTCDDTGGTPVCTCDQGYDGDHCETCAAGNHPDGVGGCALDQACQADSCSGHGSCDDTGGVIVCTCTDGFTGPACADCAGCAIADTCHAADAPNPDNACQSCQPAVAADDWSPLADDTPCPDGDVCNGDETCQAGACMAGTALDCSDGDACTDDLCNAVDGCVWTFNTAPCDDADPATTDDTCDGAGTCAGLVDRDEDGVADYGYPAVCPDAETEGCNDNCLGVPNPDQHDADGNGLGDECDLGTVDDHYINGHVWSPDGSRIALVQCPAGQGWACDLVVADPDLTHARIINKNLDASNLADWDGDWILFRKYTADGLPPAYRGDGEFYKIRSDGNDLTQVTYTFTDGVRTEFWNHSYDNIGTAIWARFVPGAGLVYFEANDGNGWYSTFVCNADGSDQWRRISPEDRGWGAARSPAGDRLYFSDGGNYNVPMDITGVDLDGADAQVSRQDLDHTFEYDISPDGLTMVYVDSGPNGDPVLRLVGTDGSNDRPLTDQAVLGGIHRLNQFYNGTSYASTATHWNPFSHDGQRVIFIVSNPAAMISHIYSIGSDGAGAVQLSNGPVFDWAPRYSPDGQYVSWHRLPNDFDFASWPWPTELVVQPVQTLYDDFEDASLDGNKWTTWTSYGGTVVERNGVVEVRGYADSGQTGRAQLLSTAFQDCWSFSFDMLNEGGPGCQGWWIAAYDESTGTNVEVVSNWSDPASCGAGFTDPGGSYRVTRSGGQLLVFKDGQAYRQVDAQGLGPFQLRFYADNVYGSGHHAYIFVNEVYSSPSACP